MSTAAPAPKLPSFYLSFDQVKASGLLHPDRLSELERQIEERLSIPQTPQGKPITTARLADLSPYGLFIYPRVDSDGDWDYAKRQILAAILTEEERTLLDADAFVAARRRRKEECFAKAEHILEKDWHGGVFKGDNYYSSTEELHDYLAENLAPEDDYPTYCWAAKARRVIPEHLEVADLMQHLIEQNGWQDMETKDLRGVERLQGELDAFVDANSKVLSYWEDTSKAILLVKRSFPPVR